MRALALVVVVTAACGPGAEPLTAEGQSFGHFSVTASDPSLEGLDAKAPWTVQVGGIGAYDVEKVDARTVKFTVQGHPTGGVQPISVTARKTTVEVGRVKYEAPNDSRFARVVAFGASLTMGSQNASITARSQLHGPAVVLARQLGAYLAVPLLRPDGLPSLSIADINPATCRPHTADIFGTIGARAQAELLPKLKDSAGNVHISKLRIDAALDTTNVAIGGFRIGETVSGAKSLFGIILEHVVWEPNVDVVGLLESPKEKMLDRVVAQQPTLVLTTDLFGNDYNNVNLHTDGVPDLAALTPVAEVRAHLKTVIARLEATNAEVFMATGPDNTVLPQYAEKVAALKAKGFSEHDATEWLEALRQRIRDYNQALRDEAAGHPRVHVVDLHARVADVLKNGVVVEGQLLRGVPFGGLLSLDSMHFSDTGYGVMANAFLEQINADLGTSVPLADLGAIHARDRYSVEALRAAGLSCAGQAL